MREECASGHVYARFYLSIIWATDLKLKSLHVCNIVFSLLWGTRG